MADFDSEDEMKDIALKVFGTPERELRRRNLHPGQPKKHDEEIDSELQQQPNGEEAQVGGQDDGIFLHLVFSSLMGPGVLSISMIHNILYSISFSL